MTKRNIVRLVALLSFAFILNVEDAGSQGLSGTLDDVKGLLNQVNGLNVKTEQGRLIIGDHTIAYKVNEAAGASTPEAFEVKVAGNQIALTGSSELAIEDGLYYILERLGYRFLLAGTHWTIVPDDLNWGEVQNISTSPDFLSREFFPGYIDFPYKDFNTKCNLTDEMELWQRRLRLRKGIDVVRGHYGGQFNNKYKKQISANAEIRPMIGSKRVPWSANMKLCFTDPATIDLYVNDAEEIVAKYASSGKPKPWFVNVEPTDGLKHCECPECLAAGSVSNRVFTMVNEVAEALKPYGPDVYACVLGYSAHAATPSFDIEENVFISVAPFMFQEYTSPDNLMRQWGEKSDHIGIRLYWQLAMELDLPQFNYLDEGPRIIKTAYDQGYRTFVSEATSGLVAGMIQYISSKLLWDRNLESEQVLADYCDMAFEAASADMQEMYKLFARGFSLETDIPVVQEYLSRAMSRDISDLVRHRLTDVAAYVQYLVYAKAYKAPKSPQLACDEMVDYIWETHNRQVVSAWPVTQAIEKRKKEDLSNTIYGRTMANRAAKKPPLKPIKLLGDAAVMNLALGSDMRQGDAKVYQKAQVRPEDWSPESADEAQTNTPAGLYDFNNSGMTFTLATEDSGPIELLFDLKTQANNYFCSVVVTDVDGNVIMEASGFEKNKSHRVEVPASNKLMKLEFTMKASRIQLKQPIGVFAASGVMRAGKGYPQEYYFAIPAGVDRLIVRMPANVPESTVSIEGDVIEQFATQVDAQAIEVTFDAVDAVRIGTLKTRSGAFELVNIPHVVSFSSAGLPAYKGKLKTW